MIDTAPRLNFKAIATAALNRADALVPEWLPDGQRQGPEWLSRNPTRHDAAPGSFSVNLTTGKWGDFATDAKGGDLISLLAYLDGTKQGEAARKLRELVSPSSFSQGSQRTGGTGLNGRGFSGSRTVPSDRKPGNRELPPIPRHAQDKRPAAHRTHGKPTREWVYRNAKGEPLFWVCRFDPPEGRKQFSPLVWNPETSAWQWKAPPAPRPLYGLDKLACRPMAPVIVTEGEKSADAAQTLFPDAVVVTSMNGAQSPGITDWTPLATREVRAVPSS